jgi:hypothetical protein
MLVNLGSTTAANVFTASPKPGISGTLPIDHGGTGASSAKNARSNLELGYLKANFKLDIDSGTTGTITIPASARGILIGMSVTAAQHFACTIVTTSGGAVRMGQILAPSSGVNITTGTGSISIDNSGSYTLFVYWLSLSGDDVTA